MNCENPSSRKMVEDETCLDPFSGHFSVFFRGDLVHLRDGYP